MTSAVRPRIVLSRCIEVDHCRWNSLRVASDVVKLLLPHVDIVPVCPEVEIGLGVPRPPIRVIKTDEGLRLYQPETARDCTVEMERFSDEFLGELGSVDGFILKSRSPSCGSKEVRVYQGLSDHTVSRKGVGFFAAAVAARYEGVAIEDEGRLTNWSLRHHFFTRIYAMARFRSQVLTAPSMQALIGYHAAHKLLIMACNERQLRMMGRIVANHDGQPLDVVVRDYEQHLALALQDAPRYTASINVLMHAMGYFDLTPAEKRFFLDALDDYRASRVPLSVPIAIVRSWIVRFGQPYLAEQAFFAPYPEELVQVTDSGKGRDT